MDYIAHGVTKSRTRLSKFHFHFHFEHSLALPRTSRFQAGFRKGGGTRDQIANIRWIIKKARECQKNICFIDYAKAFMWITTNCGKF